MNIIKFSSVIKKIFRKKSACLLILLSGMAGLSAQITDPILSPLGQGYIERARLMLRDKNFLGTEDQLRDLLPLDPRLSIEEKSECRYMLAMALYERGDEECVSRLEEFISEYPASPLSVEARLTVGDYYFFSHEFGQAYEIYSKIDTAALNATDRNLYTYRKALCMVKTGRGTEARNYFERLQQLSSYRAAATFYLAYIDYIEGDYDKAYRGFSESKKMISESSRRKNFNPTGLDCDYYLNQIDFTRAEYSKVISQGKALLERQPVTELIPETERIIGESYFKLGNSSEADIWLRRYISEPGITPASSAVYTLGVIDYDRGNYEQACERFSTLSDRRDAIGQSASLYLGQSAVRIGDDAGAAMSFEKAYRMGFDRNVTETALYNYVASRTNGGSIPFGSSIDMIEDFLEKFPSSEYASRAEEYLAEAYYNEKDYTKALASIAKIKNPSSKVLTAKQKILYELGVSEVSNGSTVQGASYLEQAIALSKYDKTLADNARLWLGDAYYDQGSYAKAATAYQAYLKAIPRSENRSLALYDLAYSYYMQDKYKDAATQFAAALSSTPPLDAALRIDAIVREADCRYYTGDWRAAMTGYEKALAEGTADKAYVNYRLAVMTGIGGDLSGKLRLLEKVINDEPDSPWIPRVLLEKSMTQTSSGQIAQGRKTVDDLLDKYPQSPEARAGLLQTAFVYASEGNGSRAEEIYKDIIKRWPSSEEAQTANEDLRMIYARAGTLDAYREFLSSIAGAPRIDDNEMERLSYEAGANAYASESSDTTGLERYVNTYPSGRYVAQALYDLAEASYNNNDPEKALSRINQLLDIRPDASVVPEALLMKGEILEEYYPERRAEAEQTYLMLERRGGESYAGEAYAGLMRTASKASSRLQYARRVQSSGGLTAEQLQEASYIEAIALNETGNRQQSERILSSLSQSPQSLYGAKATIELASLYLDSKRYEDAEQLLTKFTEDGTPHQYELARAYILLADTYHALGKNYLAVEYLKSLKENYPGREADIKQMIDQRLSLWK